MQPRQMCITYKNSKELHTMVASPYPIPLYIQELKFIHSCLYYTLQQKSLITGNNLKI